MVLKFLVWKYTNLEVGWFEVGLKISWFEVENFKVDRVEVSCFEDWLVWISQFEKKLKFERFEVG